MAGPAHGWSHDSRPDRMRIRRLMRTPALPAGSLSALLAPYGGAMRTGAQMSVGSAPNCRGIVSTTSRRDNNAHLRPNG
eukprot:2806883-Prymnesium_polylepis.1